MNRLLLDETVNLGGHEWTLDDALVLQNGLDEVGISLESFFRNFDTTKTGAIIISGGLITDNGSSYDVSAGWLLLDGKIWSVIPMTNRAKTNTPLPSDEFYFTRNVVVISEDYGDGSTHDVSEQGSLRVLFGDKGSGDVSLSDCLYINILSSANVQFSNWGQSFGSIFKVQKQINTVVFQGSVNGVTQQDGVGIFTLPVGFRPSQTLTFICYVDTSNFAKVSIASSGTVTVDYHTVGVLVSVDLSAISFIV